MQSLETTSSDSKMTSLFGTWKLLSGNECGRVARGYGNCWRLWRLLEAEVGCPRYDGKCCFYFNYYFSVQLQQTKTSDRKLSIFRSDFNSISQFTPCGNCLPETELLQSPFRTEFSTRLDFIQRSDWQITVLDVTQFFLCTLHYKLRHAGQEYFWIKLNCATITNQKKIRGNLPERTWNIQPIP